MARLPRVYIEGILYYVTSKSGHNQNLFEDRSDYRSYTDLLSSYKSQYGFKLYSYVLMPSHLHLLIELKNNMSISNIMHDVNSLYTKNFNSRYSKKGHLFQERFKTLLAEKERYILPFTRHIHLHPVKGKLADDPKEYPYSSHGAYLDDTKRSDPDMVQEIGEVFGYLKGGESEFERYVSESPASEVAGFKKLIHKKRILGSREFQENIRKKTEEAAKSQSGSNSAGRPKIAYLILGLLVTVVSIASGAYFYRQATRLRTALDGTIATYDRTLKMLKRERELAIRSDGDPEKYTWKIRLTEKALDELKEEREKVIEAEKELEGRSWNVEVNHIGGPVFVLNDEDTIHFRNNAIWSSSLVELGYPRSNYSKTIHGKEIVWEAIQTAQDGSMASWHGEWNGAVMKGVLSIKSAGSSPADFSFKSIDQRR